MVADKRVRYVESDDEVEKVRDEAMEESVDKMEEKEGQQDKTRQDKMVKWVDERRGEERGGE